MGDMADYYLSMTSLDPWEDGGQGEYIPRAKVCAYCNKGGLQWGLVSGKWRLQDRNGNTHFCKSYLAETRKKK